MNQVPFEKKEYNIKYNLIIQICILGGGFKLFPTQKKGDNEKKIHK